MAVSLKKADPSTYLWAVTATRQAPTDGDWECTGEQLPTFYLDPVVQGIMSKDHAVAVAHDVVGSPAGMVHVERVPR